jgi:hypothetical protein
MTQIFPQPSGFVFQNAGPVYALQAEGLLASLTATATASIAVNDHLHISFSLVTYGGEPIRFYHGTTLVETLENAGLYDFMHTADNTSTAFKFESGPNSDDIKHLLGAISIIK